MFIIFNFEYLNYTTPGFKESVSDIPKGFIGDKPNTVDGTALKPCGRHYHMRITEKKSNKKSHSSVINLSSSVNSPKCKDFNSNERLKVYNSLVTHHVHATLSIV